MTTVNQGERLTLRARLPAPFPSAAVDRRAEVQTGDEICGLDLFVPQKAGDSSSYLTPDSVLHS